MTYNLFGKNELLHHGVKGQKWGRRNGPPYPLKRSGNSRIVGSKSSGVIEDALREGKIKLSINRENQMRHNKSTHLAGRGYIDGDFDFAQELVNKLSNTGEVFIDKNGNWNRKEMVVSDEIIGTYVNPSDNKETRTNKAMIIYSKTGTHIYPRKENN